MGGVKMATKKTKAYPESFRREAVKMADQPDRTATEVAAELGIHVGQIYNWRTQFNKLSKKQFTLADGTNYSKEELAEIRRLKKEVADLKDERDFLKKATAYFAKADE
jgi:transposase